LVVDTTHRVYYVEVPHIDINDLNFFEMLATKVMDVVKKEHITPFNKHLLICDPTLGIEFL
jgi:pentose-5-phosphate-3-epimerase